MDCHACTSYLVFKEPATTHKRQSGPGCSLRPIRRAPETRCKPFSGEPFKLTKTHQAVSTPVRDVNPVPAAFRPPWQNLGDGVRRRLMGSAFRGSSLGPRTGPTWGRTPKANLDDTRRGWACQPISVVPAREPYRSSLRRPRTPARSHALAASHTAGQRSRDAPEYTGWEGHCQTTSYEGRATGGRLCG